MVFQDRDRNDGDLAGFRSLLDLRPRQRAVMVFNRHGAANSVGIPDYPPKRDKMGVDKREASSLYSYCTSALVQQQNKEGSAPCLRTRPASMASKSSTR